MKYALTLAALLVSSASYAAQGITEWDCTGSTYTITMNENVTSPTVVLDGTTIAAGSVSTNANVITVTGASSCPPASLTITVGGTSFGDTPN